MRPVETVTALQQPDWGDPARVACVRATLAALPALTAVEDVLCLRAQLAAVAAGEAYVIQAGDCAEDPAQATPEHTRRKSAVLELLAATLKLATPRPVLRVGRIAGQFAKPRSHPVERVGDLTLPVYRGHMVNSPEPDPELRRPDPDRMLACYAAASETMRLLGWHARQPRPRFAPEPLWTSHEALLLDYEVPMVRQLSDGRRWLASAHWPWIGERTRQVDGAHVDLLAGVVNPVACKVGPGAGPEEVVALCERLDPRREPGRLTLIARMGADFVCDRLPALVRAVRSAGHRVIWLCDPMHGNTVLGPGGRKTRDLATMAREVRGFRQVMVTAGGVAGGLHLETTPEDVAECIDTAEDPCGPGTTFCDPRLNVAQAVHLVTVWCTPR